jgi:tripartite-type tricarboxylate transporter receptor subunit TctC
LSASRTPLARRVAIGLAVGIGALAAAGQALAQAYPNRPITVIVPYPAGGGADIGGRTWAGLLEKELGVPVNVVNRGGGAAVPGHTAIATAKPDGYTIGVLTNDISLYKPQGLATLTHEDLRPLGQATRIASGVNVIAGSPYKTLKDLADAIKSKPGQIKATGAAQGVNWHIAFLGLMLDLGVAPESVVWVPTQGGTAGHLDVAAGNSTFSTASMAEATALIAAGKLQPLAVMADQRLKAYPQVPTLREAIGSKWTYSVVHGIAGPKDLPDDIAKKLTDALAKVIQSDAFREAMAPRSIEVAWMPGDAYRKALAEDLEATTRILQQIKK